MAVTVICDILSKMLKYIIDGHFDVCYKVL